MGDGIASLEFCLAGKHIGHSLSPALHGAVFEQTGLPWEYRLCECADSVEFRRLVYSGRYSLLNVTTPYKREAFACGAPSPNADAQPLAEQSDAADAGQTGAMRRAREHARFAGGANVLLCKGGGVTAFNVDGIGFVSFLKREGVRLAESSALVCGTGPAARAICAALRDEGAAAQMLSRVPRADALAYDDPAAADALRTADIVVNATPLGMREGDPSPFDVSELRARHTVVDAVYGHGETALVRAARSAGCRCYDGVGMLVGQAVETACIAQTAFRSPRPLTRDEIFAIMCSVLGKSLR